MLEFKEISKRYRRIQALDGLSLHVEAGEIYGLLGPNGAGKSTALKIATGLVRPDRGEVLIGGDRVAQNPVRALLTTGALVDAPAFPGYLTGRQNLAALERLRGGSAAASANERDRLLARVGLASRADDRVNGYSSGMKQRLGLAAALMGHPRLIILDEPTNGLDPEGRDDILALARDVVATEGPAILFTSHIFDEVARLCDRVGILSAGRLVHEGPATDADKLRQIFFAETRGVPA